MNFTISNKEKHQLITSNIENLNSVVSTELKSELVVTIKEGNKNLVLDLGKTVYADSSGLSAVLLGNRLCRDAGGTFVLTGLNQHIAKLIEIAQLDRVLNITPTINEAVDIIFMEEIERNLGETE
jgi:anti-anti-sigma factor